MLPDLFVINLFNTSFNYHFVILVFGNNYPVLFMEVFSNLITNHNPVNSMQFYNEFWLQA